MSGDHEQQSSQHNHRSQEDPLHLIWRTITLSFGALSEVWFAEFQVSMTSRRPLPISAIIDDSTFLTFSVRHCLSTVIT